MFNIIIKIIELACFDFEIFHIISFPKIFLKVGGSKAPDSFFVQHGHETRYGNTISDAIHNSPFQTFSCTISSSIVLNVRILLLLLASCFAWMIYITEMLY